MLTRIKEKLNREDVIFIKIKVKPGANKTQVKDIFKDEFIKIDIVAQPIKGKANQELINFLAHEFDVPENNVKIIRGLKNKVKLVKIKNDF